MDLAVFDSSVEMFPGFVLQATAVSSHHVLEGLSSSPNIILSGMFTAWLLVWHMNNDVMIAIVKSISEVWSSFLDIFPSSVLMMDSITLVNTVAKWICVFQYHLSKHVPEAFSEFNCSPTFHTDIIDLHSGQLRCCSKDKTLAISPTTVL